MGNASRPTIVGHRTFGVVRQCSGPTFGLSRSWNSGRDGGLNVDDFGLHLGCISVSRQFASAAPIGLISTFKVRRQLATIFRRETHSRGGLSMLHSRALILFVVRRWRAKTGR
jgi:hypothetical protein